MFGFIDYFLFYFVGMLVFVERCLGRLFDWFIGCVDFRAMGRWVDGLVGCLVGCLIGSLVGWWIGWLVDWVVG